MRGKIEIRCQKRVDQSTLPEREAVEASIVFQRPKQVAYTGLRIPKFLN